MSTHVETKSSPERTDSEHDRKLIADFLKTKGYEQIELKGHGQNLMDPTDYAFEWGSAKKDNQTYTLMITRAARQGYDPNGLVQGLLLHQQRFVSEGVNKFLERECPQMNTRLLATHQTHDIDDRISVAVQEYKPGRFLGNQRNLKLENDLAQYFPSLSTVLHALDNLTPNNAPPSLLKLARNYPQLPESLEETKQQTIQKAQERLKKLIGNKSLPRQHEQPLTSMISNYAQRTGFSLFDRTPWTTKVGSDDKLTLTNYWWAGFRDKYYDPIYFFIKTWGHAGKPGLAKLWLRTHLKNVSTQERGAFETQFWNLATIRLLQDIEESKLYPTQEQFKRYQQLLNLVSNKNFKAFLP